LISREKKAKKMVGGKKTPLKRKFKIRFAR